MTTAFLVSLFEHKAWCNRGLVKALRAAPADADRRQMAVILYTFDHTAIVDRIFRGHLSGEPHGCDGVVATSRPDLDTLARTMAETDAWYVDYVSTVSAAELEREVDFAFIGDDDPGRMTKGQMLAHVVTHGAGHRGAIGKMLEALGVPGAGDMVTSFVSERRRSTP